MLYYPNFDLAHILSSNVFQNFSMTFHHEKLQNKRYSLLTQKLISATVRLGDVSVPRKLPDGQKPYLSFVVASLKTSSQIPYIKRHVLVFFLTLI